MINPIATLCAHADTMTPEQREAVRAEMTRVIEEARREGLDTEGIHSMELARAWITSPEFRAAVSSICYDLVSGSK